MMYKLDLFRHKHKESIARADFEKLNLLHQKIREMEVICDYYRKMITLTEEYFAVIIKGLEDIIKDLERKNNARR